MGAEGGVSRYSTAFVIRGALICAAMLAMCGCSTMQVWMGTRVRLEKVPIASMQASLPMGPAMFPGEKTPLVVTTVGPDGKVLATEGAGGGKILWEDLRVSSTIVEVDEKGIVTMPSDPRVSYGAIPHLTITAPTHPEVHADLDIPLRYDEGFVANFSGHSGRSGADGFNGMDGFSGRDGSIDGNNSSPGEDGTDGSGGGDGWNGGPGEDAPDVQVRLTVKNGERQLLQVSVTGDGREEYFLIDPAGGSLMIRAEGGKGGPGGRGGRGGRGGSGGSGFPSGLDGRDGLRGHDGWAGPPGKGGMITVAYDPRARPFLPLLRFSTNNGDGTPGPPPLVREEPVPPLW